MPLRKNLVYQFFLIAVSLSAISLANFLFLTPTGQSSVLLVCILIVSLNTWYLGLKVGFPILLYSLGIISYFIFISRKQSFPSVLASGYEMAIFVSVALIISLII